MTRFLAICALLAMFTAPASGQRFELLSRTVAEFDFEKSRTNFTNLPLGWIPYHSSLPNTPVPPDASIRVRTKPYDGFHRHTRVGVVPGGIFLDPKSKPGQRGRSLKLELKGGSARVQLKPGLIPATEGMIYQVSAYIRTNSGYRYTVWINDEPIGLIKAIELESLRPFLKLRSPGAGELEKTRFDAWHAKQKDPALTGALQKLQVAFESNPRVKLNWATSRAMVARARMTAFFIDAKKNDLTETFRHSPLVGQARDNVDLESFREWQKVTIRLPQAPQDAKWILLRLELLQPSVHRYGQRVIGNAPDSDTHIPNPQDLHAAAWFDNVKIERKPVLHLQTQNRTNLVRKTPVLSVIARDPDPLGKKKTAQIEIRDIDGNVAQIYDTLSGQPIGEARQQRRLGRTEPRKWKYNILTDSPRTTGNEKRTAYLPFGFYVATLRILDGETEVARTTTAFGYLPKQAAERGGHYAIIAEDLTESQRQLLPPLMNNLRHQTLVLNVWSQDTSEEQLKSAALGKSLRDLMLKGHRLELSLPSIPKFLADQAETDTDKVLAFFRSDPKIWEPALGQILAQYGHRVERWHIGRSDKHTEAFDRNDLQQIYDRVRQSMNRYVANPEIVLPWSSQKQLPKTPVVRDLMMHLPTSTLPHHLPTIVKDLPAQAQITTLLETYSPESRLTHRDRATDLALRMVYLALADQDRPRSAAKRMAIERPWTHTTDYAERQRIEPDPLLLVWENLASRLGNRRIVGSLKLGPGRAVHILEGPDERGALVVWSTDAVPRRLDLNLGRGVEPYAVDIWSNQRDSKGKKYLQTSDTNDDHQLDLSTTPMFIEDVELPLMKLHAAFAVLPNRAEAIHAAHRHQIRIHNPWPYTLSGTLRITDPRQGHWKIEPRLQRISIPPGKTILFPITLTFPVNEPIGEKIIRAELEFEAGRGRKRRVVLKAPLTVGLKGFDLRTRLTFEGPNNQDAVIRLRSIRSAGPETDQPSFYVIMAAPGRPIQQKLLNRFATGDIRTHYFRIPNAWPDLAGERILVGLRQIRGPALLNTVVEIPPR